MTNATVQVTDRFGGSITAQKDILTGYIFIESVNGRTGESDSGLFDPEDPTVKQWLKEVFQPIHLDILLGN